MRPADYLDMALTYIRENAYFLDNIPDWEALHRHSHELIQSATETTDTYPVIDMVLAALGDHHSFLNRPQTDLSQSPHVTSPPIPLPHGRRLNENWGYVTVPGFSGTSEQMQRYAKTGHELIRGIGLAKGWIVDLRLNTGGNMFPMLATIGPLTCEDILGNFVKRDGSLMKWGYRDGASYINDEDICVVADPVQRIARDTPIAVLIGENTGSSGEITLISLFGQTNIRTFGTAVTYGTPTANESLHMPDGAFVAVTMALTADRTGRIYQPKAIEPDVLIKTSGDSTSESDMVLSAALEWLQ